MKKIKKKCLSPPPPPPTLLTFHSHAQGRQFYLQSIWSSGPHLSISSIKMKKRTKTSCVTRTQGTSSFPRTENQMCNFRFCQIHLSRSNTQSYNLRWDSNSCPARSKTLWRIYKHLHQHKTKKSPPPPPHTHTSLKDKENSVDLCYKNLLHFQNRHA